MRIGCIVVEKPNGECECLGAGRDIVGLKKVFKELMGNRAAFREATLFVSDNHSFRVRGKAAHTTELDVSEPVKRGRKKEEV